MGALKAALTAIFSTNTYTSSTSGIASKKIPVTESNGLPSGQIGMSDLASILGDRMKERTIKINGANGKYTLVFTLPRITQGLSYLIFSVSWGTVRVYDIVVAGTNSTNVWLTKRSLMDEKMKYYYRVNGDNVEIYAHDYTSAYLLVTGMYSIHAFNANVTHKNEAVSTLPSDCVEAENYSG